MHWDLEPVWVAASVRSPAFRRPGPAKAGTPNRRLVERLVAGSRVRGGFSRHHLRCAVALLRLLAERRRGYPVLRAQWSLALLRAAGRLDEQLLGFERGPDNAPRNRARLRSRVSLSANRVVA